MPDGCNIPRSRFPSSRLARIGILCAFAVQASHASLVPCHAQSLVPGPELLVVLLVVVTFSLLVSILLPLLPRPLPFQSLTLPPSPSSSSLSSQAVSPPLPPIRISVEQKLLLRLGFPWSTLNSNLRHAKRLGHVGLLRNQRSHRSTPLRVPAPSPTCAL